MKSIIGWWRGDPSSADTQHSKPISYCCSDTCRHARQICPCQRCSDLHRGHIVMEFKKFQQTHSNFLNEIKTRTDIEDRVREFQEKLVEGFDRMLEEQGREFMEEVDNKIFGKKFKDIYNRYSTGKAYYSCLPQFTTSCAQEAAPFIYKQLEEKLNKIMHEMSQTISASSISLERKIIASIPRVRNDPSQTKVERIKSILPFSCQLVSKFQASRHRFQTTSLHKLGIRGPILLVAESYKGRVFGGFCPKMFPKNDTYEQDNRCQSFLFSLDHRVLLPLKQEYKKFAIKGGNNLWFGRGDLVLADQCNKANISWAHIGRAYQVPSSVNSNYEEWLAGSLYFSVVEYEIYEVEISMLGGR